MKIEPLEIEGSYVFEPKVFGDSRGYFFESFNKSKMPKEIQETEFVQDNESLSSRGVLRGLHLQEGSFAQAKLVRAIQGSILDVFIDVRKESKTFQKKVVIELDGESKKQVFIPRGCAHGFLVLSETAIFSYKVDNYYSVEHENGIHYADKDLAIEWPLEEREISLSEKDKKLPNLADYLATQNKL